MHRYYTMPVEVKARRMTNDGINPVDLASPNFIIDKFEEEYKAGDWLVTTPNGITRVWTNEAFHENYETRIE